MCTRKHLIIGVVTKDVELDSALESRDLEADEVEAGRANSGLSSNTELACPQLSSSPI